MKRRMIFMLMLVLALGFGAIVYADGIEIKYAQGVKAEQSKVDLSKYEIIKPTKGISSTGNKAFMLNGKSIPGSNVVIEVYSAPDITKKSYDLSNLPNADDYILLKEETVKTGNMGFFQKQIDLVSGINRLLVKFDSKDIAPVEIIVYVYENLDTKMQADGGSILPLLR